MSTKPEALSLCDTWTINYGLDRSPHDLHELWRNGAPPGCALALKAAVAEIRRIHTENAKLKTVMIAAAEEIGAHWDAHCDADGYGPVNLMRRLEEGIPSEYCYTAGAWAKLLDQRQADEALLREIHDAFTVRTVDRMVRREAALSRLRQRLGE